MDVPKDINYAILLRMEDKELVKFCQVNKKANNICNDQTFWLNRIMYKFPYIPIEVLNKFKGDRSWSNYYIYDLRNVEPGDDIFFLLDAQEGRLDHIMILTNKGMRVEEAMSNAISSGNLDLVKYLVNIGYNIKDLHLLIAVEDGKLDIVKYLVDSGLNIGIKYMPSERGMTLVGMAKMKGYSDIADYLISKESK